MKRALWVLLLVLVMGGVTHAGDRIAILPPYGIPLESQLLNDFYYLVSAEFSKQGKIVLPMDEVVSVLKDMKLIREIKSNANNPQKLAEELWSLGYSKESIEYTIKRPFHFKPRNASFLLPMASKDIGQVAERLDADVVKLVVYRHGIIFVPTLLAAFPVDLSKPDLIIPAIFNLRQGISAIGIAYYHGDKLTYSRYAIASFRGTVSGQKEFLSFTALRLAVKKLFKSEK
ncbi:MAG: hypothetical protein J7L41_08775 [Synergistetes bacterium]|nr:hypothetical protein [Synergistota bacterium]